MLFLATSHSAASPLHTAPPPRHTTSQATQMQRATIISSLFLICLVLGDAMCAASVKREQYTTLPLVGKAVSLYEKYMPIINTAERMYTEYAATCNFGEAEKSPSEIIDAAVSLLKLASRVALHIKDGEGGWRACCAFKSP